MAEYATTKLSSKGQVVIPEQVRNELGLKAGDRFVVIGDGNAVILTSIDPPGTKQFRQLLAQARKEARRAGITKSELKAAISNVRRRSK